MKRMAELAMDQKSDTLKWLPCAPERIRIFKCIKLLAWMKRHLGARRIHVRSQDRLSGAF